jgi:hypothetical protein
MAVAQFELVERYWQSRLAAPRLAAALVPSSASAAVQLYEVPPPELLPPDVTAVGLVYSLPSPSRPV